MTDLRDSVIIGFIINNIECSSKEIYEGILCSVSYKTVKRILGTLVSEHMIITKGKGKGTKYLIPA